MIREWVFSGEFSSLQNYDWSLYQGGFDSLSLPPKQGVFMKIKNDKIGYPILCLMILAAALVSALVSGGFGIIIFFLLIIPLSFLIDSYLIE